MTDVLKDVLAELIDKVLQKVADRLDLQFFVERDLDAFQMIYYIPRANVRIKLSSLSYVSGLFNIEILIFYPNRFWHAKLKGWITFG
jgi:hypothetical protein